METTNTPQKKIKKSKTIWALSLLSISYIGIVYFLIKETKVCDDIPISPNWFKGFWDQYLGCRSVNELGDTLAGAFAPVAFLWLMGAVFIQSQELKAQREELDETQEVMRAQLKVSLQQVEETKASTALLKIQTDVLEKDRLQKDQQQADHEFDQRMRALLILIKREYDPSAIVVRRFAKVNVAGAITLTPAGPEQSETLFPRLGDIEVEELGPAIALHRENMLMWLNGRDDTLFTVNWSGLDAADLVINTINEILDLEEHLSNGYKERLYAMDVEGMIYDIQSIVDQVESLEKLPSATSVMEAPGSAPA